ncbi:MAG TPA: GNAT family N-acetyltransferase [Blastocatellia bacterium]|nr:GNAT family N-acetyltransferase [Blastocatellia bacterium]
MPITLRDTVAEDESFLFELYASTRAEEMALVPWNDEQRKAFLTMQFSAQDSYYRERFSDAGFSVILRDDLPVGRFYVLRDKDEIRILDITILPASRSNGIGTALLSELLTEAMESRKPVRIHVETFNPSVRLFERLGFKSIAEEGFNFLMEWRAEKEARAGEKRC